MRIFNTFTIAPDEANKIKPLLEKYEAHFCPQKNLTHLRHKLLTCKQVDGESIEQFITELKNLALASELGELRDSLVKDLLICGLKFESQREKLLQDDPENLDDAIKMCINMEKTIERNREITNKKENIEVNEIGRNSRDNFKERRNVGKRGVNQRCTRCDRSHDYGKCPAYGKQCMKCGNLYHFSSACRKQNDGSIETAEVADIDVDSWVTTVTIEGQEIRMELDTGAQANIIPVTTLKRVCLKRYQNGDNFFIAIFPALQHRVKIF